MNSTVLAVVLMLFVIVGLTLYVVGIYNHLVRLSNNIHKAWSNIEVILKQRHDELPKLVEVCNSYMAHERVTLEAITQARSAYAKTTNIDEKAKAENRITSALGRLFAVAENYPDLKANQEFLHVQQRISALENTIADRREFYNDSVNLYNIRIAQIPDVFVANQLNYRARPLLEVPQAEKQDVQLAFANRARKA
ncbi:MAG: LemA family protein [Nitrospiraceae bacterium]